MNRVVNILFSSVVLFGFILLQFFYLVLFYFSSTQKTLSNFTYSRWNHAAYLKITEHNPT